MSSIEGAACPDRSVSSNPEWFQQSTPSSILPSPNLSHVIPRNETLRWVGSIPSPAPRCVPSTRHRTTTRSPSATVSSTIRRRSGKEFRNGVCTCCRNSSCPRSEPERVWPWLSGVSSSRTVSARRWFQTSSNQRRAIDSFEAGMGTSSEFFAMVATIVKDRWHRFAQPPVNCLAPPGSVFAHAPAGSLPPTHGPSRFW